MKLIKVFIMLYDFPKDIETNKSNSEKIKWIQCSSCFQWFHLRGVKRAGRPSRQPACKKTGQVEKKYNADRAGTLSFADRWRKADRSGMMGSKKSSRQSMHV